MNRLDMSYGFYMVQYQKQQEEVFIWLWVYQVGRRPPQFAFEEIYQNFQRVVCE